MLILACLLLSLYVAFAIDLLSFSLRRKGWLRFVSTFLLFYAQVIITEFLLGFVNDLQGYTLAALNIIASSVLLFIIWRGHGVGIFAKYFVSLRRSIASMGPALRNDPLWLGVTILLLGFLVWIIFLGVIFPATDYDGNSYHLTFIGYLLQNHSIFDAPTSIPWLTGYPKGGELIQAWTVLIAHNDMLVDLTQVPFLFLAVYALYEVATKLGASQRQARFSALLFAFLPVVLNQLKTTYVDVILASVFFAGMAMVIQQKLRKLDFVLIGIVFSLLVSVKSTGFLFVAALVPLLLWTLYRHYGKQLQRYITPLLLIAAPTLFGFYWYIKDAVLYGSPLYPFGVRLAGITLFHGKDYNTLVADALQTTSLPHGCIQRIWFVWTEQKDWFGCFYNYDTNYAGLGPIWFIVLIPAILISLYIAIKKRNVLYAAVAASVIGLFAIYPANFYSRYTMFITLIGVIALGIVLTNIANLTANIVKAATIILVISVMATNFTLCNFAPRMVSAQVRSIIAHPDARGPLYAATLGEAFSYLEGHIQSGETVAYDSNPFFIYPLWRSDFSDKVIYIPAANEASWYRGLASAHARYVFTTIGSKENKWAQSRLQDVYKDATYEIYKAY